MPRLPDFPVEGGCVCGAVRYRLIAPPLAVYACHCKDCQRDSSGPYAIGVIVRDTDVELTKSGHLRVFQKRAESGRDVPQYACAICGTRMWHRPARTPDQLILKAGTLDNAHWARPVAHIWTAGRLPWVSLESDALAFDGPLPDRHVLYAAWEAYIRS